MYSMSSLVGGERLSTHKTESFFFLTLPHVPPECVRAEIVHDSREWWLIAGRII